MYAGNTNRLKSWGGGGGGGTKQQGTIIYREVWGVLSQKLLYCMHCIGMADVHFIPDYTVAIKTKFYSLITCR